MHETERLQQFLAEQKYMTLAVVLDNGLPWATPVRIKRWEGNEFEWDSRLDTEHSRALAHNPNLAISIWTPDSDRTIQYGMYAQATAKQIGEPSEHGTARYRATVLKVWVNDGSFVKREVPIL